MAKIAILSFNGSTGKTLIATHLFLPRMGEDTTFFAVETINLSAADLGVKKVETLAGRNFGELVEMLVLEDNAIVDIGASNIEAFFSEMSRFDGAIEEFDKYVVPATPEVKSWKEAIKTISALETMGVPPEKIVLLPNRIENADPKEDMPEALAYIEKTGQAQVIEGAFIHESEVFDYLSHKRISFDELIGDNVDYKQLAREAPTKQKAQEYAKMFRWTRQAIPIRDSLDETFKAIMES